MRILIAAACLSVILLTVYVIGGDYISAKYAADEDFSRKCKEISSGSTEFDSTNMTVDQKRAALDLADKCLEKLKGRS